MKNLFLLMILSLALIACERRDNPTPPSSSEQNHDNTGKNVRDRDSVTKTPMNQSETQSDRAITQKIRQAIMSDKALSTNAKNIKIITVNGVVTLRGPVANSQEKEAIEKKANDVQGVDKVDNQLEIAHSNY